MKRAPEVLACVLTVLALAALLIMVAWGLADRRTGDARFYSAAVGACH
jgi:hypothetical protein